MEDLNDWDVLFDKSKATKVPAEQFPGNAYANNLTLELEDVNEEVTDEVEEQGSSKLQQPLPGEAKLSEEPRLTVAKHQNGTLSSTRDSRDTFQNGTSKDKKIFHKPSDKERRFSFEKKSPSISKAKAEQQKCSCHKIRNNNKLETSINRSETTLLKEQKITEELKEKIVVNDLDSSSGDKHVDEESSLADSVKNEKSSNSSSETLQETISPEAESLENHRWKGRPITFQTVKELKALLFGSVSIQFGYDWQRQNICLNKPNHYALRYHKGSTQGVMSCLQAHILKHVLFDGTPDSSNAKPTEVDAYYKKCMISGMSDILWQAGMNERAVVCLPTFKGSEKIKMDFKQDELTEKLNLYEFTEKNELEAFLKHSITMFEEEEKFGCILFIYSTLLSRTTARVHEDIADPSECLIGKNNLCSQSLINLLLVGRATPYVFNGTKEITAQSGKSVVLHGIKKRSNIGFLSSEEALDPKRYLVGSMLKTPIYPIWVASYDGHFCVLFCKKKNLLSDWKLERRFDLYHFAGILRHFSLLKADIKLSIDTMRPFDPSDCDDEIKSTLEDTIRTKWQDCLIDWNGSHRF